MKKVYLILFLVCFLNGKDSLKTQQKNVLYVQKLIAREEEIAKEFERYILENFEIPKMIRLRKNKYLGTNFPLENSMGADIAFKDRDKLQIKYAITNSYQPYVEQLYKRDLYRDRTSVYKTSNINNSYTQIVLKSKEAQNLYKIIKSGVKTEKRDDCTVGARANTYCIDDKRKNIIRHFNSIGYWIDYDKNSFEKGNVTIQNSSLPLYSKLNNLAVGVFIIVKDKDIYIKTKDEILKVD